MPGNVTNGTRSYSANGLNQYTAAAGSTLAYDGNGNLTGDGTWTYGYDQNNRLKTAYEERHERHAGLRRGGTHAPERHRRRHREPDL